MKDVLLIDDDIITHTMVRSVLTGDLKLVSCYSLAEAESYFDSGNIPILVIIDRRLPDGDGINLCSKMRNSETIMDVPIIFMSGKTEEMDVVGGLFAGADDYICKPVRPLELKARIQARLRVQSKKILLGKLVVDLSSHRAYSQQGVDLVEIDLTRIEFKLLITFMLSPDKVFSRDSLITKVWGINSNLSDRVIDTHISHLRKKIADTSVAIEALRGEGYRIKLEQLSQAS
jgi:DNA-binding response OmpR family regulator